MHFFHLIQQSAPHIYHSALPLSPRSSLLHSIISQEKTLVAGFHGRLEAWGAAIQTIKASSGRFTLTTTFGSRIAAACDDGTVSIYDSVTGVLRLSLNPGDLVNAMGGSPDGSVLFYAHEWLSITAWDIQTGGLIHTFVPEWKAEDLWRADISRVGCSMVPSRLGKSQTERMFQTFRAVLLSPTFVGWSQQNNSRSQARHQYTCGTLSLERPFAVLYRMIPSVA